MTTFDLVSYFIMNTFLSFTQCLFSFLILKPKFNKYLCFLTMFIPYTFGVLSQKLLPGISPIFLVIATYLFFIAASFLLFKDKFVHRLFALVLNVIINVVVMYALIAVWYFVFKMEMQTMSPSYVYICTIIFMLNVLIAYLVRQKFDKAKVETQSLVILSLLTVTQVITELIIFAVINADVVFAEGTKLSVIGNSPEGMSYMMYIIIPIFILSDIMIFYLMRRMSRSKIMEQQLQLAEYRNSLNYEHYRELENNQAEIRKLRHDMANLLQVSGTLMESSSEDSKNNAAAVLTSAKQNLEAIHIESYSKNNLVNAIVSTKASECRKKDINAEIKIDLPEEIAIEEFDLCRVFTNLFDNAIEAAGMCENKTLSFAAGTDNGMLFVSTVNPAPETKKEKADKKNHGLGLKILNSIATKYNGNCSVSEENGIVKAAITLKQSN